MIELKNNLIGIAVSTYTQQNTDVSRYQIIERSLDSLVKFISDSENRYLNNKGAYSYYTVIVVDGPIPDKHKLLLQKYHNNQLINLHFKKINGGVARSKNTSIKLLMDKQVDIGFLMDDDVEYKLDCLDRYVDAILKGQIHHMSYCQMNPIVHPKSTWEKRGYVVKYINQQSVMNHKGRGVGCLLSFTPELINKIGYFKVMEGKYGYEHINFTYRALEQKMIPFVSDIVDVDKYIDHIGFEAVGINKYKKSHSIIEEYRVNENNKNKIEWSKDLDKYEPCIE
jgi:hypothetical protein